MGKYSDIDFSPPKGVREEFKEALDIDPDLRGDGLESATIAMARKIANGQSISPEQVRKGYRFWSRNERFLDEPKDSAAWVSAKFWGGRSGKSWYNKLYEQIEAADKEMKQQNVLIYTNVGKAQITDTDSHFKITGIPITKNDSVMNRVLYPADENQRGMPTLKEKPITLRHPEVDGVNVSATQGRGLNYFSGSLVESEPYIENGTWKIDALINKKKLAAQDDGERWTEILSNKELFGVSTGLTFERNGDSGDGYDMVARNQQYDHLAFLDPKVEKPAGGENTMVRFNSSVEAGEIIVHNIEQADEVEINQEHKGLFNKFLSWLGSHGEFADDKQTSYNNTDSKTNGDRKMRNLIEAKLTAAGIEVNGLDESALFEAYNEYMDKSKSSKKKDEEDEENMEDKDKKKMSKSNSEDKPAWVQELLTKVNTLETAINANAEAELNQVAEQVAALNMGLDAEAAKKLGLEGAKSFLAANSQTSATGFPLAQRSSAANQEEKIDVDLNAGIE